MIAGDEKLVYEILHALLLRSFQSPGWPINSSKVSISSSAMYCALLRFAKYHLVKYCCMYLMTCIEYLAPIVTCFHIFRLSAMVVVLEKFGGVVVGQASNNALIAFFFSSLAIVIFRSLTVQLIPAK